MVFLETHHCVSASKCLVALNMPIYVKFALVVSISMEKKVERHFILKQLNSRHGMNEDNLYIGGNNKIENVWLG